MKLRRLEYENFTALGSFEIGKVKERRNDPPCPEDSAADLAIAKARGKARAEGFEEGVRQAEARMDRELQDTLSAICAAVELCRADRAANEREMATATARIATGFLRAIAPRLAETALPGEIESVVAEAVAASGGATIAVDVPPGRQAEIEAALQGFGGACDVRENPALDPSGARVGWDGGFDQIDTGAMAARALSILEAHLSGAEASPEAKDDITDATETER